MPMNRIDTSTLSHSAIRTVRRTSRTACLRRPSSAAISGADAPIRPEPVQSSRPKIATPSDEAASAASPSRATKMTSTACTIIWSRFAAASGRSEEHTSELQSLMRISYAVFCLKNKKSVADGQQGIPKLTHIQSRNIDMVNEESRHHAQVSDDVARPRLTEQ